MSSQTPQQSDADVMQQMMRQMDLMRQALEASQSRQSEMQQAFTVSLEASQARQNELQQALLQVQGVLIDVQNRSSSQSAFRGADLLKSAVKAPCPLQGKKTGKGKEDWEKFVFQTDPFLFLLNLTTLIKCMQPEDPRNLLILKT